MGKYKESIDKEIYPAIKALNRGGYKTQYSCSGHGKSIGYISFVRKVSTRNIEPITVILKEHGIKKPRFFDTYKKKGESGVVFTRKPIDKFKVIDFH